ncbi:hypothetical protein [Nocardiopsis composta]|uniref:Type II toxin-antitoxin system HicB family antitoxin n=1 Tax=Nocardiopsis composta TaxID=157465 RepID=A0A7W8VFY0_9ACTN|nr:hypothetical protein [Nocardiopsis composta]MBB5434877.1 hypothetical protein [Nocardiopsis composta]
MSHTVPIPYRLEQDEDGVWCAEAAVRRGVTAFGYGDAPGSAMADLHAGVRVLIEEFGPPEAPATAASGD